MAKINFYFVAKGCVEGADICSVKDEYGKKIDVTNESVDTIVINLKNGIWRIDLEDYQSSAQFSETELLDYEKT